MQEMDTCLLFLHVSALETVCTNITQNNNELKDEHFALLYKLFGKTLFDTLELIEKDLVELVTITNTNRKYFTVQDSQHLYYLYQNIPYCHCDDFKTNFINKKVNNICKHILACKLAFALNKHKCGFAPNFVYSCEDF